jgi:hypothetical protein
MDFFQNDNNLLYRMMEQYLLNRILNGMPVPPMETKLRGIHRPESVITQRAVDFLVAALTSKAAAANMTNQAAAQQIIAAADESIATFLDSDDICPPWPYPGPPPWLSVIASELTLLANTLQVGALQASILQLAGEVLDRGQALATGTAGTIGTSVTARAA